MKEIKKMKRKKRKKRKKTGKNKWSRCKMVKEHLKRKDCTILHYTALYLV
jgi:hypothetical protein